MNKERGLLANCKKDILICKNLREIIAKCILSKKKLCIKDDEVFKIISMLLYNYIIKLDDDIKFYERWLKDNE